MLETLKDLAIALVLAMACGIGAYILKTYKKNVLATILGLVKEAESAIGGSGLGADKKAKVIAQLEAIGIKATDWVSAEIDNIVAYLNEKSGWFTANTKDTARDAAQAVITEATEATESIALP